MTPLEMQIRFQRKASSLGIPDPLPSDDIFYYLNLAQEEVVRGRFSGRNRTFRSVEESQEVIDDLEKILLQNVSETTDYVTDFSYKNFYADRADLPTDRLFILSIRTESLYKRGGISWEVTNGKRTLQSGETSTTKEGIFKHVQTQSLLRLLSNPYGTTTAEEPLGQQAEEHAVIYTDETFIVDKVFISYLKKPREIVRGKASQGDQNCELPEILHKEVVQTAIQLHLSANTE